MSARTAPADRFALPADRFARPTGRFARPAGSDATEPPERRGLSRDGVRMLLATGNRTDHLHFRDLPTVLAPGDLVVVNTSATLPAALHGRLRAVTGATPVPVHVATALDGSTWVLEVRRRDGRGPQLHLTAGLRVDLPDGVEATLVSPCPQADPGGTRLWRVAVRRVSHGGADASRVDVVGPAPELTAYLARHGRPITYGYLRAEFPLGDYQTIFALQPGSAEMPSAGRPFTERLVLDLATRGIAVVPIVLHAGVSSPELHEPPAPERFAVSASTARLVNAARAGGGRVVAVGTTVVRALETCADAHGIVRARTGWTDLVLGPDRPAHAVTGVVTGLHEPEASHLLLLEAVAGPLLVARAYAAVTAQGAPRYLWHEFGDSMLLLP
ncbi:MAG: S-adenosylmethionine:tRNA ribosyltransferase-isomerase [Kineosporiaceae bacterium]